MYEKIGSKYSRKFGKNLKQLSVELKVTPGTIVMWARNGFDIYQKAKERQELFGNKKIIHLWHNLKSRCGNPKDKKFKHYGGRGILLRIDRKDLVFLWNRDGADLMKQPSIDRIDPDGHYELENCRFVEMEFNRKNRKYKKRLTPKTRCATL